MAVQSRCKLRGISSQSPYELPQKDLVEEYPMDGFARRHMGMNFESVELGEEVNHMETTEETAIEEIAAIEETTEYEVMLLQTDRY